MGLFWRAGGRVLISVFSLHIREYESVRQPNLRKSSRKLLREPTTMMNGTDPPTLDDIEKPPDLLDKKYAFETDEWLDPPVFSANLMKTLKNQSVHTCVLYCKVSKDSHSYRLESICYFGLSLL